jgi:transaldolase
METSSYLRWLAHETPTDWWHDSGDPDELDRGLTHGASGVTTNPVLAHRALRAQPETWRPLIGHLPPELAPDERAIARTRAVVNDAATKLAPQHTASDSALGYVCAQVNPTRAGDREDMLAMARRYHTWAPNIAIKLPVTAAGLDVLEECIAEGITITATVSFTVPQVIAVAERHRRGLARARQAGIKPGRCFAVIMIGRLDDYVRDVAQDSQAGVTEVDIRQAGLAVTKRAHAIYTSQAYEAKLLVAALRGTHHMTELCGARLIMSIHPTVQNLLLKPGIPRERRIDRDIASQVIDRLCAIPEFVRSFEPDGMKPEEFISFGATQRTLSQFNEVGWAKLASFDTI